MTELHRLFEQFDWGKESGEARYAHRQLKRALVDQFNAYYGRSMGDVRSWRSLCWAVGIDEIPRFPRGCQKVSTTDNILLISCIEKTTFISSSNPFMSI